VPPFLRHRRNRRAAPSFIIATPWVCRIFGDAQEGRDGDAYLPVYADEAGNTPSGSATITVSPDRIQALGVTTEPVRRERLQRTLRAVGNWWWMSGAP
jgi:hypothetical protein